MVGIKLADGGFYPILDEHEKKAVRLTLTTVRDEQTNVRIDLYRGEKGIPLDQTGYIASLILESIPPEVKGLADIELSLFVDEKHYLSALAKELTSGEYQSLRINLEEEAAFGDFNLPDFTFEEKDEDISEEPLPRFAAEREPGSAPRFRASPRTDSGIDDEEDSPVAEDVSPNYAALSAFILFGFIIVFALIFLFFTLTKNSPTPALEAGLPLVPFILTSTGHHKK